MSYKKYSLKGEISLKVLKEIDKNGKSATELSRITGYSRASISNILNDLYDKNIVEKYKGDKTSSIKFKLTDKIFLKKLKLYHKLKEEISKW